MGTSIYSMSDIANLTKADTGTKAEHSTSREKNTELTMQDFLQLMVVQLQNQTMDDTMDTSEMMNQMVQMQMVQAISNMNELSVMSYSSSLVGKVVTIGILNGNSLEEREVLVTGTGVSNGQQVIFGKDSSGKVQTYALNQIMAVGQLPPLEEEGGGDKDEAGDVEGSEGAGGSEGSEGTEGSGGSEGTGGAENTGGSESSGTADPSYDGSQGAPTDE